MLPLPDYGSFKPTFSLEEAASRKLATVGPKPFESEISAYDPENSIFMQLYPSLSSHLTRIKAVEHSNGIPDEGFALR